MQFMLVLYEDPELIATEEQRTVAVQRVGEYAMGLIGDGTLRGGAPLHPVTQAKRIRTRDGRGPCARCCRSSSAAGRPGPGRTGSCSPWTRRTPPPRCPSWTSWPAIPRWPARTGCGRYGPT